MHAEGITESYISCNPSFTGTEFPSLDAETKFIKPKKSVTPKPDVCDISEVKGNYMFFLLPYMHGRVLSCTLLLFPLL